MAKLNSPYIENKLPAFTTESVDDTRAALTIPFIRNRLVSNLELATCGMSLVLKNAATNKELVITNDGSFSFDENNTNLGTAIFTFDASSLVSGQYYKVQIAFNKILNIDEPESNWVREVGYYSQVGIIRFIKRPQVYIDKGDVNSILASQYEYKGVCKLNEPTEKVYSYCFNLYDENNELIDTTGTQIHDASRIEESLDISTDSWPVEKTLDANQVYTVEYIVTTINGYSDSIREKVIAAPTKPIDWGNNIFTAELDQENALIKLSVMKYNKNENLSTFNYNFVLLRADSDDDFETWHRVSSMNDLRFENYLVDVDETAMNDLARYEELIWTDTTVEFGKSYKYALQAYNSYNIYSNPIYAYIPRRNARGALMYNEEGLLLTEHFNSSLYVDFDDMFLTDGNRQLRIQFNPQVSSFKTTILETKVDTIGSKHPFIFRNGTVKYKEFPISGLISKLMDPNEYFKANNWNQAQKSRENTPSPNLMYDSDQLGLTSRNIKEERDFRNEVVEWLQNGEVKIFKSPTEGNFLVRLMNVTTSPNQTLGRMLSTFSCQAYEIADYNFANLKKYNLIQLNIIDSNYASRFGETILNKDRNRLVLPNAFFVRFVDIKPYTRVHINMITGGKKSGGWFTLPTSGVFELPLTENMFVTSITLSAKKEEAGCKVIYGYYDLTNLTNFHFIERIEYKDIIVQHGGGFEYDATKSPESGQETYSSIAVQSIRDIARIDWIKIYRRPIYEIYEGTDGEWYLENNIPFTVERRLNTALYHENGTDNYRDYLNPQRIENSEDFQEYRVIALNDNSYQYSINNVPDQFNVTELAYVNPVTNIDDLPEETKSEPLLKNYIGTIFELDTSLLGNTPITQLKIGNGLILEMAYLQADSYFDFKNQNLDSEVLIAWEDSFDQYNSQYQTAMDKKLMHNYYTYSDEMRIKRYARPEVLTQECYDEYISKTLAILKQLTAEGVPK